MVAQEWVGRKLNNSVYFEPDEQGLDLFSAYLTSLKNEPVTLLLDLIEEEFRQITIPLLRGADRSGIIERNFIKFFRNASYRHAVSQQILKKKRKEERLLLTGLTNQDLLKPWLDIIDTTRTPLSGIISLPLISESLVPGFKAGHDCVVMVSQQVPSNLRQSVFIKGKLILSRLVPIASFYQGNYAADLVRDIESTKRYLVSQRIVDRNDIISVQILCNKRHFEKLIVKCVDDGVFEYGIHNINDMIKKEKMEVADEQDFSSILFCFQATRKLFVNHYARASEKKYFYHYLTALISKVASIALIAVGIGMLGVSIARGMLYDTSKTEMQLLEKKYESKFNQLNERRVDSDISTSNLKNVVKTVERLKQVYQRSPREMMAMVSRDISLFSDMRVNRLQWLVASSDKATEPDSQLVEVARDSRRRSRNTPAVSQKIFEIVNVTGELLNFDGDYRYALSLINDIEDTMKISGKYSSVQITRRPLNIDSDEALSGDVSNKVNTKNSSQKKAEFGFRVVREVKLDEK